jgi:hypothetical protein
MQSIEYEQPFNSIACTILYEEPSTKWRFLCFVSKNLEVEVGVFLLPGRVASYELEFM